jgi:transcriptional regulator with XRE-family HTH domain
LKKGGQELENWIATVVGKMHLHKIKQDDLAAYLGISREHLNRILNGKENPANAKANITAALDKLIKDKKGR